MEQHNQQIADTLKQRGWTILAAIWRFASMMYTHSGKLAESQLMAACTNWMMVHPKELRIEVELLA